MGARVGDILMTTCVEDIFPEHVRIFLLLDTCVCLGQEKVCFRSPDRVTLLSPTGLRFLHCVTPSFFIEDHIEKKNEVNRTTLRKVMRF